MPEMHTTMNGRDFYFSFLSDYQTSLVCFQGEKYLLIVLKFAEGKNILFNQVVFPERPCERITWSRDSCSRGSHSIVSVLFCRSANLYAQKLKIGDSFPS